MELPERARLSDSDEDDGRMQSDPHSALDIDLDGCGIALSPPGRGTLTYVIQVVFYSK